MEPVVADTDNAALVLCCTNVGKGVVAALAVVVIVVVIGVVGDGAVVVGAGKVQKSIAHMQVLGLMQRPSAPQSGAQKYGGG